MIRRNIISGLVGQAVLILLGLFVTRLVFKNLGAEVLGIINFSILLTSLLILLADMGLSMLVSREVAAARSRNIEYARELASSIIVIAWLGFLVSCVIVYLISPSLIDKWLQFENLDREQALLALQLISLSLLLAIPRSIYGAVISGFERMDWWNVANVGAIGIQQLGLVVVLMMGGNISQIVVWYMASAVIGLLLFIVPAVRLAGFAILKFKFKWGALKQNSQFAIRLFTNSLLGYVMGQADRWIISKFLPLSLLGYYGFAQSLVSKGAIVPGSIANAAFPALSTSIANENKSAWLSQYHKLQDLCCYVCVPVFAGVSLLGIVVTGFIFNEGVVQIIWLPLTVLAMGQLLLSTLCVPNWLAIAMKKPEISMRANIGALFFVFPFAFIFIIKWELLGASLTALLYGAWQLFYFTPRFCKQCLTTNSKAWYFRTLSFLFIGCTAYGVPSIIAFAIFGKILFIPALIVIYILGTAIFMVVSWPLLNTDLKQSFKQSLNKFTSRTQ